MKAVVVDIEGKYAVVLAKNGSFIKVKNREQYKVGHEIEVSSNKIFDLGSYKKIISIAAAIILFIGIGAGTFAYKSPYSYIDVDINPSVEITTNIFDRIINITALNEDGKKIISHGKYKNQKLETGIDELLKGAVQEGYLKAKDIKDEGAGESPDNAIMFTVSGKSDNKVSQIRKEIQNIAKIKLKAAKVKSEIVVENISMDRHDSAVDMGVSPGKMILIEKLQETKPEIKVDEYVNAPVKDIMKIIKSEKDKKQKKEQVKNNDSHTDVLNKDKAGAEEVEDTKEKTSVQKQSGEVKPKKGASGKTVDKQNKTDKEDKKNKTDIEKGNTKVYKKNKDNDKVKQKLKGNKGKATSPPDYIDSTDNSPNNGNAGEGPEFDPNKGKADSVKNKNHEENGDITEENMNGGGTRPKGSKQTDKEKDKGNKESNKNDSGNKDSENKNNGNARKKEKN